MITIPNELTIKYSQLKYSMGTGSDEWQNVKADFELESDAFGGTLSHFDHKSIDNNKVGSFISDLEKFKQRVESYNSKDDVEKNEKNVLLEKINIALEVYKMILNHSEYAN